MPQFVNSVLGLWHVQMEMPGVYSLTCTAATVHVESIGVRHNHTLSINISSLSGWSGTVLCRMSGDLGCRLVHFI